MKDLIAQVDKLLSELKVSGDDVFRLAGARNTLGEVFRMMQAKEEAEARAAAELLKEKVEEKK